MHMWDGTLILWIMEKTVCATTFTETDQVTCAVLHIQVRARVCVWLPLLYNSCSPQNFTTPDICSSRPEETLHVHTQKERKRERYKNRKRAHPRKWSTLNSCAHVCVCFRILTDSWRIMAALTFPVYFSEELISAFCCLTHAPAFVKP